MPKPRRTRPTTDRKTRPRRRDPRVLVHLITEPKRPLVGTDRRFRGNLHRPADWHTFGFDECQAEMKRRKALLDLLTDEESDFLNHYCRLRDE